MPEQPFITLTGGELVTAATIGGLRMARAQAKRRSEPYGHPQERGEWDVVIEGVAAEMAVAKALNVYWGDTALLDYGGDVGAHQVRSTDLPNGHLLIYDRDADDAVFILAVGRALQGFTVKGWIHSGRAKTAAYFKPDSLRVPCYMIPQSDLEPLERLP
jgi:hypothetical protein